MDNSFTLSKPESTTDINVSTRPKIDAGQLFNLCLNIQTGFPLLDKPRRYLDSLIPETAQFLLITGNRYIHPAKTEIIPVETVLDTVKHSQRGIFCRKLETDRLDNFSETNLYAISLGKNGLGKNMAAAILFDDVYDKNSARKEYFCDILTLLRDFFEDISRSRAVDQLMHQKSSFRFVIDAETGELVTKRLPTNSAQTDENLVETIFRSVLSGDPDEQNRTLIDNRIKNYNITRFKLQRFEFILLSFEIELSNQKTNSAENDEFIKSFAHRIKNKLSSLQTAAGQLSLHSGKKINDDDVTLANIIQTESEYIDKMVSRIRQFGEIGYPNGQTIDLLELLRQVVVDTKAKFDLSPEVKFVSEIDNCLIIGDKNQLETAFREILSNSFESDGDITIEIGKGKSVDITFRNSLSDEMYQKLNDNIEKIAEPFMTLRPDKIGLGLSIADKIISRHKGILENRIDANQGMITKIILPFDQ
jgi:signal transduction histidine kinase